MNEIRIAHIADTHLGYRSGTIPGRDEDFAKSWAQACRDIVDAKPDLILHAGDIFHQPHPPWGAVLAFIEGVSVLRTLDVPILMISGNHDSSRIALKHSVFSLMPQVLPGVVISHSELPIVQHIAELNAVVVLLSHRTLLNPLLSNLLEDVIAELDESKYTILVAHGDIHDLAESEELGSVAIPKFVFDFPWSYVALGHLHMAQPFGPNGWYSGSIERCGWSDILAEPAWTLTTLSRERHMRHIQHLLPHLRMVQLPPMYCEDVSHFEITEEILRILDQHNLNDEPTIVRLLLEGPLSRSTRELQRYTQAQVRKIYPKTTLQLITKSTKTKKELASREASLGPIGDVNSMFREFVASRTYDDPKFKDFFLEAGLAKLDEVKQSVADADTGDERSVPAG